MFFGLGGRVRGNGKTVFGAKLGMFGLMFAPRAEAQALESVPAEFLRITAIEGVQTYEVQADGRLKVVLADGRTFFLPAEQFVVNDTGLFLDIAALNEAITAASTATQIAASAVVAPVGMALGGAGVAAAAVGGGGGGEAEAPTPNLAPVFTSTGGASAAEGEAGPIYTAAASDPDGSPITYTLAGGDAGFFNINSSTGAVSFKSPADFENPTDGGANNAYDIIVTASDGVAAVSQNVVITVTNKNDNAPVLTSTASATVAEGATGAVYTAAGVDADGSVLTYGLAGADAALFAIDASTGTVTFKAPPDFERPTDADGNNVYDIQVTASDGVASASRAVSIAVTNQNDNAPVFQSSSAASVVEGQSEAIYTATASDADGSAITYAIAGADAALFDINASTGVITFRSPADFEAPADENGDNIYDIVVAASDGIATVSRPVAIAVTNGNDNAPVLTSAASANVTEGESGIIYAASATDADGSVITYGLSGVDAALFQIDASTGAVTFLAPPDFEAPGDADANNVYDIVVAAADGVATVSRAVAISVSNGNDNAPVLTSGASTNVAEGAIGTIYTASATDADGSAITYTLTGADAALFSMDASTGAVTFVASPDFEAPGDANADNIYDITVTASDGVATVSRTLAINVTNENDNAPVVTSGNSGIVAEGAHGTVYAASATDADGSAITYGLSGVDAALFAIDAATGGVTFLAPPDFEAPGDADADNIYGITVTASDGLATASRVVAITVANGNDNAPVFASGVSAVVAEGAIGTVHIASATDADGSPIIYGLGGVDAARFQIDSSTGAVTFLAPPDFEAPGDEDADNTYDITVTASDGVATVSRAVAITVTNRNDNAPVLTSGASASVAEGANGTVYTAGTTDADGSAVTYGLTGADAALFTINAATGAVTFLASPDFEVPRDANANNIYDITVTASDGAASASQAVAITVTNQNDNAPVFTSAGLASVAEGSAAAVYAAAANDADGSAIIYGLTGADAARFGIDAATGVVSFIAPADFEAPVDADGDNSYSITVTASDGVAVVSREVVITVTNQNDNAPVFMSGGAASADEDVTEPIYSASASDADGSAVTYGLTGVDAALFSINPATGAVSFLAPPNFEAPGDSGGDNIYDVVVTASDGVATASRAVAITVTDQADDVPVFTSGGAASIAENAGGTVYQATAADADGSPIAYGLAGADADRFVIDAATGAVAFKTAADFEAPADADGDNVYDLTVTASNDAATVSRAVVITVTNQNDNAPVIGSSGGGSVSEGVAGAVYVVAANDADGSEISYGLAGADAALFAINPATGAVTFKTAPDFEAPADGDGNNVYDITVTASDGVAVVSKVVAIAVADINDNSPAIIAANDAGVVVEDGILSASGAIAFADADVADVRTVSVAPAGAGYLGAFQAVVTDDATGDGAGEVSWSFAANNASLQHLGAGETLEQTYTLTIKDAVGAQATQNVIVTITGANDAPVVSAHSVAAEAGMATAGVLTASDADGDVVAFGVDAGPAHGALTLQANGAYTYTAAAGYSGADSFTYSADDGMGGVTTGMVTITVKGDEPPPVVADIPAATVSGSIAGIQALEVTALKDGGHLVVWAAVAGSNPDGEDTGVYAQRYDAGGAKVGGTVLVNSTVTGMQDYPSAAGLGNGGYVVVWHGAGAVGNSLYMQRFDANGARAGEEVYVAAETVGTDPHEATVTALDGGGYVVTWAGTSWDDGAPDIYCRVFGDDGGVVSDVTLVNTSTFDVQGTAGTVAETVVGLAGGRFAVTFVDKAGADGADSGVFVRVFEADGAPVNAEQVQVNTSTSGSQDYASIGALADGGFVVTWGDADGLDGASWGVFAQRFDANGERVGEEFQVNTITDGNQMISKAEQLADGGFLIVWQSDGVTGAGLTAISGQRYDAAGERVGGEFLVHAADGVHLQLPSIALREDGSLVVTWQRQNGERVEQKIIPGFGDDGDVGAMAGFGAKGSHELGTLSVDGGDSGAGGSDGEGERGFQLAASGHAGAADLGVIGAGVSPANAAMAVDHHDGAGPGGGFFNRAALFDEQDADVLSAIEDVGVHLPAAVDEHGWQ